MKTFNFVLLITAIVLGSQTVHAAEKKILFVHAAHSNLAKVNLIKKLAKSALDISYRPQTDLGTSQEVSALFAQHDLVVLDAVSPQASVKYFAQYQSVIAASSTPVLAVKAPDNALLRKGIKAKEAKILFNYYDNGGAENFSRMIIYLESLLLEQATTSLAKPIIYPQAGIYHPSYKNLIFDRLDNYYQWRESITHDHPLHTQETKPTIGLLIPRAAIESAQTQLIDAAIHQIEARGAAVLPVFYESGADKDEYLKLLKINGQTQADTFVNFRTLHFANQRKVEFEALGRPVMQALTYFEGDQASWENSVQGISANMMAFTLVLPETAGVIEPTIVAAMDPKTGIVQIIDYQLEFLLDRALAHANLVKKVNSEKKLTLMFWGDKDMGASFLNVPDSLRAISQRLNQEGYTLEAHGNDYFIERANRILDPFYRDYELDRLLADDLAGLLPLNDYLAWFDTLPEALRQSIKEFWGEPKDNFMVTEHEGERAFVIPRIRNGNMLIMRQPPRGDTKDQDKLLYHTTTIPMNHYYLAAYYYAREYWHSDAVIHLGTHGSQEYLPGKERGLSRYDGGNLAIGSLPVMYPFIVDDVGEAMQTKRRGSAVVISHMTPPYAAAGLQGVSADIHELMHQYKALDKGGVKTKTGEKLIELCLEEKFCEDLSLTQTDINANFDAFIAQLHDYLTELAAENQPLGLHSFGELPEQSLITSTLVQMLGKDFIDQARNFERDNYLPTPSSDNSQAVKNDEHALEAPELSDLAGFKTARNFIVNNQELQALDPALKKSILRGREYYQNLKNIKELDNLSAGLSGKYIAAKTGGDPIRHPDSLPSGYNLYGFDPSRLPTKAAYDQGEDLVEELIANFYAENGHYPNKVAFSLWSIEAMRHYGVLESQALKAMGVRPLWSSDGRVIGSEIIPASELKRPRVDVVLSATGLYRDAFPNVMQRLAKAIQQVAELKEDNNTLWRNSQRIKTDLMAEGISQDEAQYLSTVRIFSNASGQYGSGVDGPIFSSDTWENDAKIADNYLSKMGYVFGADPKRWGQSSQGLYGKQLSGTEIVAFSRSSNLFGMITSDDPFEYFGSLALAVRNLDGKSPQMMISNLRDAQEGKMESAATFLAKELRTRNFNKRWVAAMQSEGYSGAVTMADNLSNFWGWQVVDPNIVRADQWQEFYEVYVNDKLELDINEWFEEVNPGAQAQLLERMLEAVRKDYWSADKATLEAMIARHQSLVSQYDLSIDNEALKEFLDQQAAGFGLNQGSPMTDANAADSNQSPSQNVEGQRLEKVEPPTSENDFSNTLLYAFLFCLVAVMAGVWRQVNYPKVVKLGLAKE